MPGTVHGDDFVPTGDQLAMRSAASLDSPPVEISSTRSERARRDRGQQGGEFHYGTR